MITTPHKRPFASILPDLSSCGVDVEKLECYCVFDAGSKLKDVAENGNDGVLTGAFFSGNGRYGTGISFDTAGDDYVTMGTASNFDVGADTDFSIWMWVKVIKPTAVQLLTSKADGDSKINLLINGTDRFEFQVGDGVDVIVTTDDDDSLIVTNTWNHLAVTVDRDSATGIRLYINGELARAAEGDMTAIGAGIDNATDLRIGFLAVSFEGHMDIWGFHKGLLDSETIRNLFNKGM